MEGGGSGGGRGSSPRLIIACVHSRSWVVIFIHARSLLLVRIRCCSCAFVVTHARSLSLMHVRRRSCAFIFICGWSHSLVGGGFVRARSRSFVGGHVRSWVVLSGRVHS